MLSRPDRERHELRRQLSSLDPLAAEVIRLRFGLDGSTPLTLDQTALRLELTPARVYELQHAAIDRLRGLMNRWGVHCHVGRATQVGR